MPTRRQTLEWLSDDISSASPKVKDSLRAEGTLEPLTAGEQDLNSCETGAGQENVETVSPSNDSLDDFEGAVGGGIDSASSSARETFHQTVAGQV